MNSKCWSIFKVLCYRKEDLKEKKITRRQHNSEWGQLENILAQIHLNVRLVYCRPQSQIIFELKYYLIHLVTKIFGKIITLIIEGELFLQNLK